PDLRVRPGIHCSISGWHRGGEMARGESRDIQQSMALAPAMHSGHMPRLMRGTAARWRTLILLSEALLLVMAVYLAIYLRFITHADPLHTYAPLSVQLVRACVFAAMMMLGMTTMGM